jgi:predicted dehydrogenase
MIETQTSPTSLSPSTRRPRLGFAGVGWIGRNRLEAIAQSGLAEICAVSDPVVDSVASIAGCPEGTVLEREFEALLDRDLDGIVIATPSALHAGQAVAALQAGKAVFCQKPLARTAAETRDVVAAARTADRLLAVDLSYRFTAGMQRIRELITGGELGEVYAVEMKFHNAYGPDKPWFYDPRLAGGGCLLDLGIHHVDLALWCLDNPAVSSVSGHLLTRGNRWDLAGQNVEDYVAAQLVLETGAVVQLACSWRAPAGCDAQIEAVFYGTRGGAAFRNVNGSFYDFTAEHFLPDRSRRRLAEPPDNWGGGAALAWVRQLARSRAYDPAVEQVVSVAETLDRIYGR